MARPLDDSRFSGRVVIDQAALIGLVAGWPDVPGRRDARARKRASEDWVMARYLAALGATDSSQYPLLVTAEVAPDYSVHGPGWTRSVELTQAIDELYARVLTVADEEGVASVPDPYSFMVFAGGRPMGTKDLRALVAEWKANPPSSAWPLRQEGFGMPINERWCALLLGRIASKAAKYARLHAGEGERADLVVYDNSGFEVALDRAVELLLPQLPAGLPFERTFLMSGASLVELPDSLEREPIFRSIPLPLLA